MEYYRYKCKCTFHTEETLLVGWGTRNIYWWGVPWHIGAGTFQKGVLLLGAGTSQKRGGGLGTCTVRKVSSYELNLYKERVLGTEVGQKWVLGSLFTTFLY